MRNTKQRNMVLDIINNSYDHPTAYMVYQECIKVLPNISLGTVYRNLNALVSSGKIIKIDTNEDMARYDKKRCHDHFICACCNKIVDLDRTNISYNEMVNVNMILECKISYEGICCDCLKLQNEGDEKNGIKRK